MKLLFHLFAIYILVEAIRALFKMIKNYKKEPEIEHINLTPDISQIGIEQFLNALYVIIAIWWIVWGLMYDQRILYSLLTIFFIAIPVTNLINGNYDKKFNIILQLIKILIVSVIIYKFYHP